MKSSLYIDYNKDLLIPKTKPGKWSLGLAILMPVLFFFGFSLKNAIYQSVPGGQTIPEDIVKRPILALTMLAGMIAGILAFITGLAAIIKQKERGLLVCFSTIAGALLIFFLLAEIVFSH